MFQPPYLFYRSSFLRHLFQYCFSRSTSLCIVQPFGGLKSHMLLLTIWSLSFEIYLSDYNFGESFWFDKGPDCHLVDSIVDAMAPFGSTDLGSCFNPSYLLLIMAKNKTLFTHQVTQPTFISEISSLHSVCKDPDRAHAKGCKGHSVQAPWLVAINGELDIKMSKSSL